MRAVRTFWFVLSTGWSELVRILRKHFGRSSSRAEDNMTFVFWVCTLAIVAWLLFLLPWQVLAATIAAMAVLLLALGWSVRK